MKIAQIGPLYQAVPPKLYGGTVRIVAHLSDALVDLGHNVTLFSSADAPTRATLLPVRDQAFRLESRRAGQRCSLRRAQASQWSRSSALDLSI